MRLSPTLTRYIGRQFAFWFFSVFLTFAAIILLFDTIELMRRAATKPDATFAIVFKMALFKLPNMSQLLVPFAMLFGSMLAFWRLTRSNELVVARAAGVSVWQFLIPPIMVALILGGFKVGIYNPFASAMLTRYDQLESTYLRGQPSTLAVSGAGLWLREVKPQGQTIVHAIRVAPTRNGLDDVIFFQFEGRDRFIGRIDAASAELLPGHWDVTHAWLTGPEKAPQLVEKLTLPTDLTWEKIEDSFAPPESLSIWDLPGFISALEAAGFSAVRHRLHFQAQLAGPLLLCAMVLIAATFSLRPNRRGGTGYLVLAGVTAGFVLYVATDLVSALGLSARIPVLLAAWSPAGICTLLGIATLLHLEDG